MKGRRGHLKGPRGLASRTWGPPPRATRAQATLEARMRAVGQVVFRVCVCVACGPLSYMLRQRTLRIGVYRIQTVPGMAQRHSTRCRCAQTENVVYMGVPNSNGPRSGPQALHPLSYMLRYTSLLEEVLPERLAHRTCPSAPMLWPPGANAPSSSLAAAMCKARATRYSPWARGCCQNGSCQYEGEFRRAMKSCTMKPSGVELRSRVSREMVGGERRGGNGGKRGKGTNGKPPGVVPRHSTRCQSVSD